MAPKKGKKASKSLKHAKKLEPTKPLSVDSFLHLQGRPGE